MDRVPHITCQLLVNWKIHGKETIKWGTFHNLICGVCKKLITKHFNATILLYGHQIVFVMEIFILRPFW